MSNFKLKKADVTKSCVLLTNPHSNPTLRDLDGLHPAVLNELRADPRWRTIIDSLVDNIDAALENKEIVEVDVLCVGGKHRSVAVAEALRRIYELRGGVTITIEHPQLDGR